MTEITLSDYVRDVCLGIIEGVKAAQSDAANGEFVGEFPEDTAHYARTKPYVTKVSFNVATKATNSQLKKGGASIKVVGGGIEIESGNMRANNISFEIPIAIPMPEKLFQQKSREKGDYDRIIGTPAVDPGIV